MDIPHIPGAPENCSLQPCPIWILNKADAGGKGQPGSVVMGAPIGKNAHLEVARGESADSGRKGSSDSMMPKNR